MKSILLLILVISVSLIGNPGQSYASVNKPIITSDGSIGFPYSIVEENTLTGKKITIWNKLSFRMVQFKMKLYNKRNEQLSVKAHPEEKPVHKKNTLYWILVALGVLLLCFLAFWAAASAFVSLITAGFSGFI